MIVLVRLTPLKHFNLQTHTEMDQLPHISITSLVGAFKKVGLLMIRSGKYYYKINTNPHEPLLGVVSENGFS